VTKNDLFMRCECRCPAFHAKPNVNAWVNKLIEHALGPRKVVWNEHFDRASSGRKFRLTGKVERRER